MISGKIAAQCSHATLACYKYYFSKSPDSPILKRWERGGQAKVALDRLGQDVDDLPVEEVEDVGEEQEAQHHAQPWYKVVCLTGAWYFGTEDGG